MVVLRFYATELPGKKSSSHSSRKDEDRSRLAALGRTLDSRGSSTSDRQDTVSISSIRV